MATISDNSNHPIAIAKSSQKPCGLLELPPELRNNIYELCFEPVGDENYCNFNAPKPPEFAILQTCGQIHEEAIQIYQIADREYWYKTHFWIEEETHEQVLASAKSVRSEKVHLMNRITIAVPSKVSPGSTRYLEREDGFFSMTRTKPGRPHEKVKQIKWAVQKRPTKTALLTILSGLRTHWALAK
ncbi:hypothetical protein KC349_g7563 [Hortaea werneckii]|nr:hypothetical protein KC349_g7563 [Hortaea werneckii]